MPINDYFRQAAALLRRAADARTKEIQDMRREITHKEQHLSQRIQEIQAEMTRRDALLASNNEDTNMPRAQLLRERVELEQEIVNTRNTIGKEKDALLKSIQDRENDIRNINQLAGDLERRQ